MQDAREAEGLDIELHGFDVEGTSSCSSFHDAAPAFSRSCSASSFERDDGTGGGTNDEVELKWAAIERLPTYQRLRTSIIGHCIDGASSKKMVDVTKLGALERRAFVEHLIKHVENDNLRLLQKQRERMDRVGVKQPTIEVRYKNLQVEAKCQVVQGKPLPTLWNTAMSKLSAITSMPGCRGDASVQILKGVSGIIRPSRMTLLLGSPGCGKTIFLKALAGRLDKSLKVSGDIEYNGYRLDEFVPEKTAAYVSQHDLHVPEMTVRETLDFSARFQGVGSRAEIMKEVLRREKERGIVPDPDIDTYMKAISAQDMERSLQTDYIMKIMGLDICADTIAGDAMRKGISGGQKKRLTTGEMIVGPSKAMFMDEISTGLDSSTTYQVVSCLRHLAHVSEATVLVSLLQPAPETYDLFDDIILMAEGKIVYHGPCSEVLLFFEECGFRCPKRKGVADFLQEVLSRKDQGQYWSCTYGSYSFVPVDHFCERFRASRHGQSIEQGLSEPYDRTKCHQNALSFSNYSLPRWEILKACTAREVLLLRRNLSVYILKAAQLGSLAIIAATMFLRTHMGTSIQNANYYLGSLFYSLYVLMVNGFPELSMVVSRLPVFYKHRDLCFYPSWAYAIPSTLLKVPISLIESVLWTSITYYLIGYAPGTKRFLCQLLLFFCVHSMSLSLSRFAASYFQTMVASLLGTTTILFTTLLLGGFLIPHTSLPKWFRWAYWVSPLSYAEIGLAVNELLAPRWQTMLASNVTVGRLAMMNHGLDFSGYFYWISIVALLAFVVLFHIGYSINLTYRKAPGVSRAMISRAKLSVSQKINKSDTENHESSRIGPVEETGGTKMSMPFVPLAISFENVNYYVDAPQEMRKHGYTDKRLQLLHNITGAFKPGVLTALMGISGAGKTTLLDVLSGRKTGGTIEGDIRVGGYPKVQESFARISGYCEQTDIHSPQITVEESVIYSAWLRLPKEVDSKTRHEFVKEVLETVELDSIKHALVGMPGVSGLSTEQRKRLTVAVELVSNPSIIFMDEPTSGLDARAAAIVMRAVKNVAEAGRTVVCTIHQPSIAIFEAFDELMLLKRGGEVIYSGQLGQHSSEVIKHFEAIPGVPKIRDNYNPATWMLEITSTSAEAQLGIDFAQIYKESAICKDNLMIVKQLSTPRADSKELRFSTLFPQSGWEQFKACLWKQQLSYWRSPSYNLVRIVFMLVSSVVSGALYWKHGNKIDNQQDLLTILGCMYGTTLFIGINNCQSVMPLVVIERNVVSRERFAGMYSAWAYTLSQVVIEIPYVFVLAMIFMLIAYPAIGYSWSAAKFFSFYYIMFCTLLYFTYFGMVLIAVTPNIQMASILASIFYSLQNLFSGFIVPSPQIPKWWIWLYHISPMSWTLNGLIVTQYGDINKAIDVFGAEKSVSSFLEDYYDFRRSHLTSVMVILLLFPLVYASLFALFIGKLNFQKR